MRLFQITMLGLLCVSALLNLLCVYRDRCKWTNAFAAGLATGAIPDIISDIICK